MLLLSAMTSSIPDDGASKPLNVYAHTHTHLQAHTHNNDLYNNAFIKHACITGDFSFYFFSTE